MKTKNLFYAFLVGACAFQACRNTNKTSNDPDSLTTASVDSTQKVMADTAAQAVSSDTTNFFYKAAVGGMMEVESGKAAQAQGSDSKVKEFGALMVKDHSKANAELKRIAMAKNVALPAILPFKVQDHVDAMSKMTGKDFDKHYMDMMVNDHGKTIELFKMASNDPDTAISNFAKKTLPVIEGHHKKAEAISVSLK